MNVNPMKTATVVLDDLMQTHGLDPITIYLDNQALPGEPNGKGKITLECYGSSWSTWFSGTGSQEDGQGNKRPVSVEEFVVSASPSYLVNRFYPDNKEHEILDEDKFEALLRSMIDTYNSRGEEEKAEEIEEILDTKELNDPWDFNSFLTELHGDDWFVDQTIPMKPHPDYVYLGKIVRATQEGLRSYLDQQHFIQQDPVAILKGLQQRHQAFSSMFDPGESSKEVLQKEFDAWGKILKEALQSTPKNDPENSPSI